MNRWIQILVILFSVALISGVWYQVTYSMDEASGFEIGDQDAELQLLIAYQGSPYKNRMIELITEHYFKHDIYLKGVDIGNLNLINPNHWDVIILIHTWEVWQPPKPVEEFVSDHFDPSKMIVFTTSGDGNYQMDNVDGITSASLIKEVEIDSETLIMRIDSMIQSI